MQVAELRRDYEGSKEWELKKKSIETQVASPPAKQKIGVAIATLLSPSSPPLPVESSTKLRGGPRNWPREVVEHVQSLLDLGWASAKVANHYSLQEFELSEAQVDLVRATPAPRPREPGSPPGKLLAEDAARVRALLMEGKTDAAVLQHHALLDSCVTLAQIQAIRAGLRREGAAPASPGASPARPPAASARIARKPAELTRQHVGIIEALVEEGRSNAYIANFHSLIDLSVLDFQATAPPRPHVRPPRSVEPYLHVPPNSMRTCMCLPTACPTASSIENYSFSL